MTIRVYALSGVNHSVCRSNFVAFVVFGGKRNMRSGGKNIPSQRIVIRTSKAFKKCAKRKIRPSKKDPRNSSLQRASWQKFVIGLAPPVLIDSQEKARFGRQPRILMIFSQRSAT